MPELTSSTEAALQRAIETHRERAATYGVDGLRRFGAVMDALFPDGIVLKTTADHERLHLFSMIVAKLNRYAVNWERGGHQDSVHDVGVYAFRLEACDEDILRGS